MRSRDGETSEYILSRADHAVHNAPAGREGTAQLEVAPVARLGRSGFNREPRHLNGAIVLVTKGGLG